jgi:hypothetical protein
MVRLSGSACTICGKEIQVRFRYHLYRGQVTCVIHTYSQAGESEIQAVAASTPNRGDYDGER